MLYVYASLNSLLYSIVLLLAPNSLISLILNAAEYGVPQQRERTIFIGTRTYVKIRYPKKTHTLVNEKGLKPALTLWDAIGDLPQDDAKEIKEYNCEPKNDYQKTIRNGATELANHKPSTHNEKAKNMRGYIRICMHILMRIDLEFYKDLRIHL